MLQRSICVLRLSLHLPPLVSFTCLNLVFFLSPPPHDLEHCQISHELQSQSIGTAKMTILIIFLKMIMIYDYKDRNTFNSIPKTYVYNCCKIFCNFSRPFYFANISLFGFCTQLTLLDYTFYGTTPFLLVLHKGTSSCSRV